jgi:hypothetical protein
LLSLADFRAPTFSLSVTRDDVGLEGEFELFMQLLGTYFHLLSCSCWHAPRDLSGIGYQHRRFYRAAVRKTPQRLQMLLYFMLTREYRNFC